MPLLIIFLTLFTYLKLQSFKIKDVIRPTQDNCPEDARYLKLQVQRGSQTQRDWFTQWKLMQLKWMLVAWRQELSMLIPKDTLWLVLTHCTNLIRSFHWVLSLSLTLPPPSFFWRHHLQLLESVSLRNLLKTQLLVLMWCILCMKQITYLSTYCMNSVWLQNMSGSAGKESACNAGDLSLIPVLGRSPGEGKGYPLQYSGLENSMDFIVHGVAKSRTWLSDFHFLSFHKTRTNKQIYFNCFFLILRWYPMTLIR